MSEIDPTTVALLSVLVGTATAIALGALASAVRRRRDERRWRVRDDVAVDLTFVQQAVEHDRRVAEQRQRASVRGDARRPSEARAGRRIR